MKATGIVLLMVVAVLGAGVLSLWRQRMADHELIASPQNRLDGAVAASRGSAQSPPLAAPIVRADENASEEEAAEPAIPAVARRPTAKEGLEAAYARNSSPENIERMRATTRARMVYQYPDVEQVLALSSEEVSKLYDLLAQQELQRPVPDPARGETLSQAVASASRE